MYYNNKTYYACAIDISFFELIEIEELNPNKNRIQIIQDVIESCLGTLQDVSYEYKHMLDADTVRIKVWSDKKINSWMYILSRNASVPIHKPYSLQVVLGSFAYNFNINGTTNVSSQTTAVVNSIRKQLKQIINDNNDKAGNNNNKEEDYNAICNKCGAPAYVGLNDFKCSNGCK